MISIKKFFLKTALILLPSILLTNDKDNPPANFTVVFNANNKQGGQTATTTSQSSAIAKTQMHVENRLTTDIKILLQDALEKTIQTKNSFISFCKSSKYKLLLGSTSGTYLYLLYAIQKCKSLMLNQGSWCCWRSDLETDELIDKPCRIICERLLVDIQSKYLIQQKNIDFLDPFARFVQEIKYEINTLKLYLKLNRTFEKLHVQKIFFTNNEIAAQVEDKLERLYFLYKCFVSWHTNRNIQQS